MAFHPSAEPMHYSTRGWRFHLCKSNLIKVVSVCLGPVWGWRWRWRWRGVACNGRLWWGHYCGWNNLRQRELRTMSSVHCKQRKTGASSWFEAFSRICTDNESSHAYSFTKNRIGDKAVILSYIHIFNINPFSIFDIFYYVKATNEWNTNYHVIGNVWYQSVKPWGDWRKTALDKLLVFVFFYISKNGTMFEGLFFCGLMSKQNMN